MDLVSSFVRQFLPEEIPTIGTIEETWSRLQRDKQRKTSESTHPKGLAMATLYMLHIERFLPKKKPHDDSNHVSVSPQRRERLKAFGNWVRCHCKSTCEVKWNFANETGLHRGNIVDRCNLVRLVDEGTVGRFTSASKLRQALERTKEAWLESRAWPSAASLES
jgi:hypothetical protein